MTDPDYCYERLPAYVGSELGLSDWVRIDQALIDAFASCTGDRQWIHVDPVRAAAESPYGGTVAHGFLLLSLTSRLQIEIGVIPRDASAAINYGVDRVRFLAPVRAGTAVRARVTLTQVEERGAGRRLIRLGTLLEVDASRKPALSADTLALLLGPSSSRRPPPTSPTMEYPPP